MRPATVVLSAEHPTYREGLAEAIRGQAALKLVAVCADAEAALSEIISRRPALGLVDVAMRPLSGLELCRAVRRAVPDIATRFVLMSSDRSAALDDEARAAGAVRVIDKDIPRAQLCALLEEIANASSGQAVKCR